MWADRWTDGLTVTWLPKFLWWIDNQFFLVMGLCLCMRCTHVEFHPLIPYSAYMVESNTWGACRVCGIQMFSANLATLNTIISTYQQSPRTPCMMSSGLGLRNTAKGMLDTLRPPPLKDWICWGRSQFATRGCSENLGWRYRDFSTGGKESSTNWILLWE